MQDQEKSKGLWCDFCGKLHTGRCEKSQPQDPEIEKIVEEFKKEFVVKDGLHPENAWLWMLKGFHPDVYINFLEKSFTQAKEAGREAGVKERQSGDFADTERVIKSAVETERQRIIGILEGLRKTDTFPQQIIHLDHSVTYLERLSDEDIHFNHALTEAIKKVNL